MSIACANREHGKHSHETVAQVKLCFHRTQAAAERRDWDAWADAQIEQAELAMSYAEDDTRAEDEYAERCYSGGYRD